MGNHLENVGISGGFADDDGDVRKGGRLSINRKAHVTTATNTGYGAKTQYETGYDAQTAHGLEEDRQNWGKTHRSKWGDQSENSYTEADQARGGANTGQVHEIHDTQFKNINAALDDSQKFSNKEIFEKVMGPESHTGTANPTPRPTQPPIETPTDDLNEIDGKRCIPWKESGPWSTWTSCTRSCGDKGTQERYRSWHQPNLDLYPGLVACAKPAWLKTGKHDKLPFMVKTRQCQDTKACPVDCLLEARNEQWVPGWKNKDGEMVMKNVQAIISEPDFDGKACPTLQERTRTKTWYEHCERVILADCPNRNRKFGVEGSDNRSNQAGCTTVGAWSGCQDGIQYRTTVKKTCFTKSNNGMEMTYKETKKCKQNKWKAGIHHKGTPVGHLISATGASE